MKRLFGIVVFFVMMLGLNSYAMKEIEIRVNGNLLKSDVPAANMNGRLLVPLRAIFEALNIELSWDDSTRTVHAKKGNDFTLDMQIDNSIVTINGRLVAVEVPAQIVNGRTMVPLRLIAESYGAKVNWSDSERIAEIIADNKSEIDGYAQNKDYNKDLMKNISDDILEESKGLRAFINQAGDFLKKIALFGTGILALFILVIVAIIVLIVLIVRKRKMNAPRSYQNDIGLGLRDEPVYAGFWKRFFARFLDGLILLPVNLGLFPLVFIIVFAWITGISFSLSEAYQNPLMLIIDLFGDLFLGMSSGAIAASLITCLISGLYEICFISSSKQATFGKVALNIIVTDEFGRKISFGKSVLRYVVAILPWFIIYIVPQWMWLENYVEASHLKIIHFLILAVFIFSYAMAGFTKKKQALHDIICGTMVLAKPQNRNVQHKSIHEMNGEIFKRNYLDEIK